MEKLGSKDSTNYVLWPQSRFTVVSAGKRGYHGIAMDTISVSLLHMVAVAGGVRAGGDVERKNDT